MKIKKLDEIEYYYIFEMDNLKRVLYFYITSGVSIENSKLIQKDKHRIKCYTKEIKALCYKLIKKDNINTTEEYINTISTLITIHSKIRQILRNKKYKKEKSVKKIESDFNNISKLLTFSETTLKAFYINHRTAIIIILIVIAFCFGVYISFLSKNVLLLLSLFLIVMFLYLYYFVFTNKAINSFTNDSINRTIRSNTYAITKK